MGFFDALTGKAQARDLQYANQQAERSLAEGRANATAAMTGGRDRALGQLNPYMTQGRAASDLYGNAIGLNGQPAQEKAFQTYSQSPFLKAQENAAENHMLRLFRQYNARGLGNSGASRLAVSRAAGEREAANQTNWFSQIQGLGNQGAQFANTAAGLESGTGQYLADLESGYGQQRAGNQINFGNAQAATRGIGVNNLLGIVGTGINAYNTFGRQPLGGGGGVPSWRPGTTTKFG